MQAKNQQQTALEGNQANQEAESGEDNRKELFDEQLQKAEAQNAGVKEARQNLQEIANELAQSGSSDVSERAKEQLQEALAKLDEIALEDADLSTDAAQERLDSKIGSGGVTLGRQLKTLELVNYFGLLRGVLVRDRPEDGGVPIDHLGMVCSFKPRFAQQEESLRRGITVVPDLTETEMSVEAESALDMQRAQSVIAAYGRSAMSTVATNYGGSVSVSVGVPFLSGGSASASFEKADSSSSASSSSGQKSTASQLRTTMTELSKSTYFFAPKLAVKIDPLMLQPSPEFKLAWSNIAHKYCLAQQAPPTPATTTTTTAFASANGSSASGTEDIELVDLEDACKKYKVDPDSVYGGSPEEETEEEEDANTAVQISFFATNFDVLATLGALPKKAFEDAVTQAMNYYGVIGDDETIKVTLSRPSKTEVDSSSLLNTVKVVVVIPAKPNEDSEPAGKSRLTFYSEWKTQGPPWGLQSRILDQFDKSDTLNLGGMRSVLAARATVTSANATWEDYKSDFLDLIHKFGSHVCPSAILGGWRNIEATYKSQESKERSEVSNVISEAIREAASSSWSASGGVSGAYKFISGSVSASGGSSSSSGSDNSNTGGSSQDTATASKTTNIQVQQSWKGGSSGTSPEDWRRSLDSSLNSNWKVIDHELPKCIGIWWFVSDDFTRNGLCNAWLQVYLDGGPFQNVAQFIEESVRDKACESTRNMALLRNDVQELLRLETAGNVRLLKQRCERNQDFKQFKLKVTTRRGDAATQARLGGVRFASEGVTRIPTSISDKAADGDYLISNSGFLLISFDAPVSVTDFSFLLTQTIANAHEDPVAFRLYGHDGTNPDALLLDFEMDDPTKQITSVPTSVRQAWSPWLGLLGGAEGYSWNDEQGICQKKSPCWTVKERSAQSMTVRSAATSSRFTFLGIETSEAFVKLKL
ncbi:unnamed protein product [Symbiodinium sp. CCMP2592]|nr:unnamed protein product [Symbiodinium sp. CCMP2592]